MQPTAYADANWPLSYCPVGMNNDTVTPTTVENKKLPFVSDPEILTFYQDLQNCGRLNC